MLPHSENLRQLRQLLATPSLLILKHQAPQLATKALAPGLALGLSTENRLAILRHHYGSLAAQGCPNFFDRVLRGEILWQQLAGNSWLRIQLAYPNETDFEGELSFLFYVDDIRVAIVSCTCAPAGSLGRAAPAAVLVSRVQGTRHFALYKLATKALYDTPPTAVLLHAVYGFAQALGYSAIMGVGETTQLSLARPSTNLIFANPRAAQKQQQSGLVQSPGGFSHDHFWQQFGATPTANGLVRLAFPPAEKPMASIPARHRSRNRRKRQFKHQLRTSIAEYVTQHLLTGA